MNRPNKWVKIALANTFRGFVLVCAGARGTEFNAECTEKWFKAPEN